MIGAYMKCVISRRIYFIIDILLFIMKIADINT